MPYKSMGSGKHWKMEATIPSVALLHHPPRKQSLLRLLLQLLRSEQLILCGNLLSSGKVSIPPQEIYVVLVNSPKQQSIMVQWNLWNYLNLLCAIWLADRLKKYPNRNFPSLIFRFHTSFPLQLLWLISTTTTPAPQDFLILDHMYFEQDL